MGVKIFRVPLVEVANGVVRLVRSYGSGLSEVDEAALVRWPLRRNSAPVPTRRRGDSQRPGAMTSDPIGGMTVLPDYARVLKGAPE
jgi:hypothetical protein